MCGTGQRRPGLISHLAYAGGQSFANLKKVSVSVDLRKGIYLDLDGAVGQPGDQNKAKHFVTICNEITAGLQEFPQPGAKETNTGNGGGNIDFPEFGQRSNTRKNDNKPDESDNPVDFLKASSQLLWVRNGNDYGSKPVPGCEHGNEDHGQCQFLQDITNQGGGLTA